MKAFLTLVFFLGLQSITHANDVLVMKNGQNVLGSVIDVEVDKIVFQSHAKNNEILKLSPDKVSFVKIEKPETLYWIQDSLYRKGITDATIHHKRFGRNFLAGFFGVTWGFIVVALVNPKLPDAQVVGQANVNNPEYLKGYRKKAKEKNVLNALAGLILPLIIFLIVSTNESSIM